MLAQKGELDSKEIVIEKDRKIELPESERIFEKINFDVPREQFPEQEYEFKVESTLKLGEMNPKLKLQSAKEAEKESGKNGRAKFGFGNYFTFLGGLDYGQKSSEKFSYDLKYHHLSSQRGAVDGKNSSSSGNLAEVNGNYFLKSGSISAKAGLERTVNKFYGYDKNLGEIDDEKLKIVSPLLYTQFNNRLNLKDTQTVLNSNLGFYHLNINRLKNTETEILASHQGDSRLKSDLMLSWSFEGSSISRKVVESSVNRHFVLADVKMLKKLNAFEFEGGLRFASSGDTISSAKSVYLYPLANIKYHVVPKALMLEIGYGGTLEKNTLRTFTREILWLDTSTVIQHNNRKNDLYGFAQSNISNSVFAKTGFEIRRYDNFHFFSNDPERREILNAVYDKGNVRMTNILVEIGLVKEKFRSSLSGKYTTWNNDILQEPIHFPTYQARWNSTISFAKKLNFSLDAYVLGGIKYFDNDENKIKPLNDIVDVNLKVDYNFSSRVGVFLMLDNIFGQKYERYRHYSVRGIQVLFGLQTLF
ncbi:MAG: hypothetical protein SNJ77_06600 [Cytophagales bacterium]